MELSGSLLFCGVELLVKNFLKERKGIVGGSGDTERGGRGGGLRVEFGFHENGGVCMGEIRGLLLYSESFSYLFFVAVVVVLLILNFLQLLLADLNLQILSRN